MSWGDMGKTDLHEPACQTELNRSVGAISRRTWLLAVTGGVVGMGGLADTVTGDDATEPGEGVWSFETGDSVFASPTVVDGTVYIGSADGTVYAINAATGEEVWSVAADGAVWSSANVVGETVFVGDNAGTVHALATDDGTTFLERF